MRASAIGGSQERLADHGGEGRLGGDLAVDDEDAAVGRVVREHAQLIHHVVAPDDVGVLGADGDLGLARAGDVLGLVLEGAVVGLVGQRAEMHPGQPAGVQIHRQRLSVDARRRDRLEGQRVADADADSTDLAEHARRNLKQR